jgi:hypothetical protein
MSIDMSWCKCGAGGICPICKVLTVVAIALVAGAVGYFMGKKK